MKRLPLLLSLALMLTLTTFAAACPNCSSSIPASDAQTPTSLPAGFNFSIYYMLVSFISVLGLIGWTLYRGIQSKSDERR